MTKRQDVLVAIDGPAGAGKSTVARIVAHRLGFMLVDTGALYRAVALAAKRADIAFEDHPRVGALANELAGRRAIVLESKRQTDDVSGPASWSREPEQPAVRVLLGGEDVSSEIRSPEMSMGASLVSAIPEVRSALLAMQRQSGERGGVVLEGRDIGTVVFPDAELKFFLTATAEERATRRFAELTRKGTQTTLDDTLAEVQKRDAQDTSRKIAPLRQADDAILVDSTGRTIDEVVAGMVDLIVERRLRYLQELDP